MYPCGDIIEICVIVAFLQQRMIALSEIHFPVSTFSDFHLLFCGYDSCDRGHSYGPAMRDHYLFVCILSGKGLLDVNGIRFHLSSGSGFLVSPGQVVFYRADPLNPWSYLWFGFSGKDVERRLSACGFPMDMSIINLTDWSGIEEIYNRLEHYKEGGGAIADLFYGSMLQLLLHEIAISFRPAYISEPKRHNQDWVLEKAVRYMELNYSKKITVEDIAKFVGLDRSYFTHLFTRYYNTPPYHFLMEYRMEKAAVLLQHTDLPISQIACSIAYDDYFHFTRTFKKRRGLSPSKFRLLYQTRSN